jgi:hypothetical protein
LRPANRWNGFMKYLAEESLSTLEPLNLTDEQRLGFMKDWGTDSAEFKRTLPLSGDELEHAKNFFPNETDFRNQLCTTIENHSFSNGLYFRGAFFARPISFENCCFERPVNFYGASFNSAAIFSDSTFSKEVNFADAQFRVAALFDRVTFCREVNFYRQQTDNNFAAIFRKAIFKTMTPRFHGQKFHPGCMFQCVTWPKIPKRNGHKKTEDTIEHALLDEIACYEYIRTQAENIGQLELRKEMIRRELACRAELAEPSFERLLRCFVSGVSPLPPGEDGPRRRRRSRPGMCFTTPAGECCRLLVAMPMLRSTPSKPYAPRRMCCIFSAPWPRFSARSFCFSWPWRSGSNSACRSDAIRRRFDPWHFPPSPRRI